ncbi:MAG: hypothetical protein ACI9MF_002601, partial [Gammaproteobacteria bacterium]
QVLAAPGISWGKHECWPDYGVKGAAKGGVLGLV